MVGILSNIWSTIASLKENGHQLACNKYQRKWFNPSLIKYWLHVQYSSTSNSLSDSTCIKVQYLYVISSHRSIALWVFLPQKMWSVTFTQLCQYTLPIQASLRVEYFQLQYKCACMHSLHLLCHQLGNKLNRFVKSTDCISCSNGSTKTIQYTLLLHHDDIRSSNI